MHLNALETATINKSQDVLQHTDLDLIVLELLFSPDAVVPHSTGDLAASNSSGGLGKSFNVPVVF